MRGSMLRATARPRRHARCRLLLTALLLAPAASGLLLHSPHDVVDAFAISPGFAQDRTLFVSLGRFNLLLRSRDAGRSFEVINAGLQTGYVLALAISPDFAADRTLYCAEAAHVFVSRDGGERWQNVPLPPGMRGVQSFELSPDFARDGTLLAGTAHDGLWLSRDRGATWAAAAVEPAAAAGPGSLAGSVQDVRFSRDFGRDRRVWALIDGHRLVASSDGGASFEDVAPPPGGGVQALAVDGAGTTLWVGLRAGLQRSTDGGATWRPDAAPDSAWDVRHLALARDGEGAPVLFVSTAVDGVWVRAGDGSWSSNRDGFRPLTDQSTRHYLGTMPSPDFARDRTVYAATFEGLYVSQEGGDGWTWLDVLQPRIVRNLALSPDFAEDGTLWLATYGHGLVEARPEGSEPIGGSAAADVAARSTLTEEERRQGEGEYPLGTSGGLAWRRLDTLSWMFPDGVAVSPSVREDATLVVGAPNRLVRSTDGGASAEATLPLKKSFARALALAPDFAQSGLAFAYLSTYTGSGPLGNHFARSTDHGASWTELSDLAAEDMVFASDWSRSGRMYVCGPDGLKRSDDRGLTFRRVETLEAEDCGSVALAPAAAAGGDDAAGGPDTLLVCSRTLGLHLSRDGGETWKRLQGGLPGTRFDFVEISPEFASDGLAFAGPRTDGVFVTRDGGATWARSPGGPRVVLCMERSPTFAQDHALLVGSYDGGWLSRDAAATWTRLDVPVPAGFEPVFSR